MGMEWTRSTKEAPTTLTIDGPTVDLPDASYITDGALVRDGMDLVLEGPSGTLTIDGYFAAESAPTLSAPNGLILSPQLVESFVQSNSAGFLEKNVLPLICIKQLNEVYHTSISHLCFLKQINQWCML